jgi:steroid 5-alpha reductase family enzyme
MLHFILNVTGIPLTEKLSLEKRGKAWLEYQDASSAFIPLSPKKSPLP